MTSYQKLKAENLKLKEQLDVVVNEPNSKNGMVIKALWRMNRSVENTIMAGTPTDMLIKENKNQ